jgi:tRNA pseudouridine65 synthase
MALVRGWPAMAGTIDRPLVAVEDERSGPQSALPRESQTAFTRIATYELPVRVDRYPTSRYALVELTPHTGRRHQLRRHLARESHPIVGDSTYGKGNHNRLFRELFGVQRLLLACTALEFTPPGGTTSLRIAAPLAAEFAALLTTLGAQYAADPPSSSSP